MFPTNHNFVNLISPQVDAALARILTEGRDEDNTERQG